MTEPLWLKEPGFQTFLHHVVDKLDAADAQGKNLVRAIRLDAKSFPALFKAELEEERERFWGHLEEVISWGWFRLTLHRQKLGQARYECNPKVAVLNVAAIRHAVMRLERVKSGGELWRKAVYSNLNASDAVRELVARYRIEIPGRSSEEIALHLNKLAALAYEPLLLREVSARLFWGQSKVLDKRQTLVAAVLGLEECPFAEMPIQLQVYLPPAGFDGVLFIENQATFEQATRDTSGRFARLALVFASGFKVSAKRLRSPEGASVYFAAHGSVEDNKTSKFLEWLRNGVKLPSWFWGDLDYSGMQILASLRAVLAGLEAWLPGYEPMLQSLVTGGGHLPESAGKSQQNEVLSTGCQFADQHLLPSIRATGRFLDQEIA